MDVFGHEMTDAMKKAKQLLGETRRQARRAAAILPQARRGAAAGAYFAAAPPLPSPTAH